MASVSRWSTPFRSCLTLKIRRNGKIFEMSFTHGDADSAAEGDGQL